MHKDDFILRTAGNVPHEDWVPQYDVGRRGCLRLGLHRRGCHLMGLHCYGSRRHAEYLMIGLARLDRRGESGPWASGAGSERPHPVLGGRPGSKSDSSILHFFVVDGEVGLGWESRGLQGGSRV